MFAHVVQKTIPQALKKKRKKNANDVKMKNIQEA